MRKNISLFILILLTFFLQLVLNQLFPIRYVKPDLLLILTVSFGFMRGRHAGICIGALCGLFADVFIGGGLFGMNTLLLCYAGFFCAAPGKRYFDKDIKMPLLLIAVCEFVCGMAFFITELVQKRGLDASVYLRHTILARVMLTLLLTIPLYPLLHRINRMITSRDLEDQNSPWLRR